MFCLNEEDEEDDLLETISGRVCFIHFSLRVHLGSPKSLCRNVILFLFLSLFFLW